MNKIHVPKGANSIILGLRYEGHEAYVVGGCVRDSLLGKEPHDWDICTSATPDEVKAYLGRSGIKSIDTGLKHGTVTAYLNHFEQYEITTFRKDGDYSDGRHPDSVEFVDSIIQDLSRRDFTINAIAYNSSGMIDPFRGQADLQSGIISCVGDPDERFEEDAIRILRALRFASTYNFSISKGTAEAIHRNKDKLNRVSPERIQSEIRKLLIGDGVLKVLLEYSDVIATIIPEMKPCIGFNQNNRFHMYTIYDHIAHAVANYTGDDLSIKIALLLHDIGKPQCYTEDERGGHFYGHGVPSHDIAKIIMERLRFDNKTKEEVLQLVLYHDAIIEPTPKVVKRWMNKIGSDLFTKLLDIRIADIKAHAIDTQESRIERWKMLKEITEEVLAEEQCFKRSDLAIRGKDILSLGVQEGRLVGEILDVVLEKVICGELENDIEPQMEFVRSYIAK